jgi:cytochrome c-type biogenesis protein CcmH
MSGVRATLLLGLLLSGAGLSITPAIAPPNASAAAPQSASVAAPQSTPAHPPLNASALPPPNASAAAPWAVALAIAPRTTLPAMEGQTMCVTCKIPLQVAQSPQADRERAFIERLIAAGLTEAQIKRALVREYGPAVLALPSGHGFDLAVYLVPALVVLALLALLALLLPRWRRRGRDASGARGPCAAPALSPADAARLDADIARFD